MDNGTNIGDAVAWALRDLRQATPLHKVLVLLTDGREEVGQGPVVSNPLDPVEAAWLVSKLGATLHTIAMGRPPSSDSSSHGNGPDFDLLRRMAEQGGGRAFVAAGMDDLNSIFREIDRLEKSPINGTIRTRYHEWYAPWAVAAMVCLALDRLLSAGRMRQVP